MAEVDHNKAYPLAWPTGWRRTPRHKRSGSRYKVTFATARDQIVRELRLFGCRDIIVSTNVPLRQDGLPYAGMREPEDPGVAVYWTDAKRRPRVMCCDAWATVRENMRAVNVSIEALRSIERARAGEILERAYTGFLALPSSPQESDWRVPLGLQRYEKRVVTPAMLDEAHRKRSRETHPDHGGDEKEFHQVQMAYEAGRRECKN